MPDLTGYYLVAEQIEDGSRISNLETTTWSSVSGTTITVASTDGFPSSGQIKIAGQYTEDDGSGGTNTITSSEIVSYTGKTSTTFTGCIFDTAVNWSNHTSGAVITQIGGTKTGVPAIVTKIKEHTLAVTSGFTTHTLTLDTAITTASHGTKFRLMRISETTFEDTPEYIEILKMHESGLKYDTVPFNLRSGEIDGVTLQYQEGLYSMYVLLDIDTLNTDTLKTLDRRTISSSKVGFTDGQTYDCYITDGYNSETKTLTATVSTTQLRFDYDGELTGNGVVSFGETFTVETPTKINITPERVYIGTTYSVGTDAGTAINNILSENDIDVDSSEKDVTFTGAIVASDMGDSATTISLNSAVTTLSDGDSIYNQDGKFIGVINSGSTTTTLTLKDTGDSDSTIEVYYRPKEGDEITKYTKRLFVLNTKFADTDVFTAVNFLASKKGLEYTYKGEKILVNNIDDYNARRRFTLRYRDGTNLISVENNTSLFDTANKVIVIGDNVRAVAEAPNTKRYLTIKHIDSNIKDIREAQIKAENLLVLHNKPSKKVTLTLEKNGDLKLMKPGDIITLNFPNHNIPPDDYIIFEIENAMSNIATVTVGTFNKTIAERLAEMNIERDGGFSTLFTKEVTSSTVTQFSFEEMGIKEQSLKWQITNPSGINIGWTTLVGWTNTLQFGSDAITTEEIEL